MVKFCPLCPSLHIFKMSAHRQFQFGPGSIIGTTDWFLERPRHFRAAAESKTKLRSISKSAFDKISVQAPDSLIVLLTIIARTSIMDATHVWEYLERINFSK